MSFPSGSESVNTGTEHVESGSMVTTETTEVVAPATDVASVDTDVNKVDEGHTFGVDPANEENMQERDMDTEPANPNEGNSGS